MRGRVWSGFIWFTLGSCGRICEHSRELSGCMWGREFIIKLSNYNILKMDCTPCILLLIHAVALLIEWRLLLLYILLKCYTGFIINHPLSFQEWWENSSILHIARWFSAALNDNFLVCLSEIRTHSVLVIGTFKMVIMGVHPGTFSSCNYFVHT